MKENEEIIITGVNGFVGEHLARHLKNSHYRVGGVGREPEPRDDILPYLDSYQQADLLKKDQVQSLILKNAAAIIHLAGLASVADSFNNPDLYITGNAAMTDNLLSSAISQGFNGRAVVISTGALYDAAQDMPLKETSATNENSPYAIGKLRAEQVAKDYRDNGHDVVIARPFNHIGPGQATGFLIPDLYSQLKEVAEKNEPTILVGNLNTKRDYTDVRDIADAYTKLATAEELTYDTYNISSGVSYSGLEILEFLKKAANLSEITPVIDESRVRPSDAMDIIGDSSRLQEELGWKPASSVQKAIEDFVNRENA